MSYDLGTAHGTIEIDYDGARSVSQADKDMDRLSKRSKDTDKSLIKMGATLKGLGKGLKIAGLAAGMGIAAAQAANLTVQLLGMVPQLTSILSLSAALPGLLVGGAAAMGVLHAALTGVGDAAKAAFDTEHPEKFEKALEKLSPAAQTFARTLKAAAPGLTELRKGLQESFFKSADLNGALKGGISALQGMKPELNGLASTMGTVVKGFTDFALQARSVEFVKNAIKTFGEATKAASAAQTPMLTGLRSVGEVGLPLLKKLGGAVGDVGTKFGNWLTEISENGQLQAFIDQAIATLKTLGSIVKNVGGILGSIFSAANATGGGLLGTIKEISGQLNTFLKSAEGKAALTSLFAGIGAVAKALAPVITTLAGALGGALGGPLKQLAEQVGPVLLEVVEALAPAFGPLAQAIADVAGALAPLLPPVAKFVSMLVQLGSSVLSTLAQALTPIITMIGSTLVQAFTAFEPVLAQVTSMLPQFAAAGLQIAQALIPLVPAILQVVQAFVNALLPVLPELIDAALQLVPTIVEIAQIFANELAPALVQLTPLIPPIVSAMVAMSKTSYALIGVLLEIIKVILQVMVWFFNLGKSIGEAANKFSSVVGTAIGKTVNFIKSLPGKAKAALSSFGSSIISVATSAWNGFRNAVTAGINAVLALARGLAGRVRGAISGLGAAIAGVARAAFSTFMNAIRSGINTAVSTARSLPGRIRSAIGNLGSLLVGAGRDVVMGLVRGMSGAIGAAVSAAANVGRGIINGIKSTLRISSPSKIMIQIGRFVNEGLVKGLTGTAKQVVAASTRIAHMVIDAYYKGFVSKKKKNKLLSVISKDSKKLQSLANKSAAVAAKLKTAQANLADIQKKYNETFAEARDATKQTFSIVGQGQAAADIGDAKARFRIAIDQAKAFAANIAKLVKKGLNKDLIAQLVAQGPEAGGAMAQALAQADDKTIKEFNALQAEMNKAADAVGKSAADSMYGAGLKAAQGLVKGLASQQKAIEKLMLNIAKSMEKAIKKALKIKSPSRIMFRLGEFIARGLALGIEALHKEVVGAAQSLAQATIMPTVKLTNATQPVNAPAPVTATQAPDVDGVASQPEFGPYYLLLDGKVVSGFVVNTITGNPKVVSNAARQGDQLNSWAGSGRRTS